MIIKFHKLLNLFLTVGAFRLLLDDIVDPLKLFNIKTVLISVSLLRNSTWTETVCQPCQATP